MDIVKQEVLDSINNVSVVTMESMLAVYDSLSREYDKMSYMMDYAVENGMDTSAIFQEGKIMDKATGKYTDDGLIKKIIMFIPRLLKAIIDSIAGVFKKDYQTKIDQSANNAEKLIKNASQDELVTVSVAVDKATNSEVKINPKTKKLSLGKKISSIWNKGTLLINGAEVLKRLREEIKQPNTDYKRFAGELKKIFSGEKEYDETTVAIGVDAFRVGLKDICAAGYSVSAACKELTGILNKKIEADLAKGESPEKVQSIKELVDQLQVVTKHAANNAFCGRIGMGVMNLLGNPDLYFPWSKKSKAEATSGIEKIVNRFTEKMVHREDYDELDSLENDISGKGQELRGTKNNDKTKQKLHKKKQKRRKQLNEITEDLEDVKETAEKHQRDRDIDNAAYESTGEVISSSERVARRNITTAPVKSN